MSSFPAGPGQPGRADPEHESLCRRCGTSCHLALPIHGVPIVVPGLHCRHLEPAGADRWTCTVYPDRFRQAPWCHHADLAAALGLLAQDCPYARAQGVAGVGKVRLAEPEVARHWPLMLRLMQAWGLPDFVHAQALLREVETRTPGAWQLSPWPGRAGRLRLQRLGRSE